jgi:hypothetical protein
MPIRTLFKFLGRSNQLLGGVQKFQKQQDIPILTQKLVENETFRNTALEFHKKKANMFTDLEKYLDKQILGTEDPLAIDSKK